MNNYLLKWRFEIVDLVKKMSEKKQRGIPVWFAVFLMIVITIVVASITYVNVTGMISLDISQDGVHFFVSNTTILEIVALVIILTFITIWIFWRNKLKKQKQN